MAVARVPDTDLYLVLEQRTDVALAIPQRLRGELLVFIALGFLGAMGVAWATTYQVVKSAKLLTASAARMAGGDLDTPIRVGRQDEIGVLASSLTGCGKTPKFGTMEASLGEE